MPIADLSSAECRLRVMESRMRLPNGDRDYRVTIETVLVLDVV